MGGGGGGKGVSGRRQAESARQKNVEVQRHCESDKGRVQGAVQSKASSGKMPSPMALRK